MYKNQTYDEWRDDNELRQWEIDNAHQWPEPSTNDDLPFSTIPQ